MLQERGISQFNYKVPNTTLTIFLTQNGDKNLNERMLKIIHLRHRRHLKSML